MRELELPAPVINAAGFVTTLGGAPLSLAASDAFAAAADKSWDVAALGQYVGTELAGLAGVPSACVVSGAAAGLALAVAACAVREAPEVAAALPVTDRLTVVAQAALHNSYDRMARLCGARIVTVGYATRPGLGQTLAWELAAAVGTDTTAVLHTMTADPAALPLQLVARIAHEHGVPVVVDAAAELPPAANLGRFCAEGADLVVFSGGKALRGPQSSGLLLGRPDLVQSARLQLLDMDVDPELWRQDTGGEPWQHGIGRAMKVGPETMLALLAAVREFVTADHDREAAELTAWLAEVREAVGGGQLMSGGSAGSFYPSLVWDLGPERARRAWRELAGLDPSVRLSQAELGGGRLRLRAEALAPGDRDVLLTALVRKGDLLRLLSPS